MSVVVAAGDKRISGSINFSPGYKTISEDVYGSKPGDATVHLNFPAASPGKLNCPASSDVTVRPAEPSEATRVTCAPRTTPPFTSRTVPLMLLAVACSVTFCAWLTFGAPQSSSITKPANPILLIGTSGAALKLTHRSRTRGTGCRGVVRCSQS